MIPIRLREELELLPGEEYQFFTHEENNRKYLCVDCGPAGQKLNIPLSEAVKVVQESGLKIVQNND